MSQVINVIAAMMHTDSDALRVAANNMSSADAVAYRRQVQVRHVDFAGLTHQHSTALSMLQLPRVDVAVDTRAGTLRNTGEPLDVAIQGDGYFVVSNAQGDFLTRRGDFHVAESGVLSAYNGDPVLGVEGTIQLPAGTVQIAADGTVKVGTATVGHLRVVQPDAGSQLVVRADGLFESRGGQQALQPSSVQFHQGFLETSNVQPVGEMLHLMEAVRHFEAGQRFLRSYDEMLDKAINDLGQV